VRTVPGEPDRVSRKGPELCPAQIFRVLVPEGRHRHHPDVPLPLLSARALPFTSNGQRTEVLDGLKEGDKILLP